MDLTQKKKNLSRIQVTERKDQIYREEAVSGKGEVLDHETNRVIGVLDASNGDISNLRKNAV
jgi:hypothetical protein